MTGMLAMIEMIEETAGDNTDEKIEEKTETDIKATKTDQNPILTLTNSTQTQDTKDHNTVKEISTTSQDIISIKMNPIPRLKQIHLSPNGKEVLKNTLSNNPNRDLHSRNRLISKQVNQR